jgi:hypothetical protein
VDGNVITMNVEVEAKTVAGTVLFTVGEPLTTNPAVTAQVPAA